MGGEEVQGEEYADDAHLKHEQGDEELLDSVVDAIPGRKDGDRRQERGEDDQEGAEAIHAQVVVDGRGSDPGDVEFEAIAGGAERNAGNEQEREKKFKSRDDHRHAANPGVIVGTKNHQRQNAERGEERENGKQVIAGGHWVTVP